MKNAGDQKGPHAESISTPDSGYEINSIEVDKKLIAAIADFKDKSAFHEIFDRYAPKIKSFAFRLGSEANAAEDIVQETMIAVWRHSHLYNQSKGSVSTWIFTIARNKRYDYLRRRMRPEPDPMDPAFLKHQNTPEEDMEKVREEITVRKAINSLPDEQSKIVKMSFYEGKTHQVLAEELNLPLGTVKSRMRLALKKIRDEVQELVNA